MNVSSKYRRLALFGVLVPMLGICVFVFLIGPRLVGDYKAARIGNTLGFWFIVYLIVVTALIVAGEIHARK
jgi:hypothetical protein